MKLNKVQDLLTDLLNDDNLGLSMYFVRKVDNVFEYSEPQLEDKKLMPALKNSFVREIRKKFFSNEQMHEEVELIDIDLEPGGENEIIYTSTSNRIPDASKVLSIVNDRKSAIYSPDEIPFSEIWGFVFVLGNGRESVSIFKKNYPMFLVKSNSTFSLFLTGKGLNLVTHDYLKFTHTFQFLAIKNDLFILDRDNFEKDFNYTSAMQAKANDKLDIILASKLFVDAVKFYDLIAHTPMLKKILAIEKKNPLFAKSAKQIKKLAKKYNIELNLTEDENKIDISSKKQAKEFLSLLNDDLLLSEMSDNKYKTKGKSRID